MIMDYLRIDIKPELLALLPKNKKSIEDKVNLSLAVLLFLQNKVTLAKAAELAERSLEEFIEILKQHDIPWGEYTEKQYKQDLETIEDLMGGNI